MALDGVCLLLAVAFASLGPALAGFSGDQPGEATLSLYGRREGLCLAGHRRCRGCRRPRTPDFHNVLGLNPLQAPRNSQPAPQTS
jgi:hypothetical protein